MTAPRITIITFAWPPRNSIGAHRPYSWAKYWSQSGAKVRVLTARKYAFDEPLDLQLPPLPGVEVIETDYRSGTGTLVQLAFASGLKRPLRWLYRKLRGGVAGVSNPRDAWPTAVMPDINRLATECDFVVSTYDPKSVHLLAAAMKSANSDLFWVADYRDLWSLNHAAPWTPAQRQHESVEEKASVGRHADLLTSVSEELASQLSAFLAKPALTVTNGFDIDEAELAKAIGRPLSQAGIPLRLVYTGKIYAGLRDPSPLLEVIAQMEMDGEIAHGAIELHIYGGQVDGIEQILRDGKYDGILHMHGHVTRDEALRAQSAADLLLLLESPRPDAAGVLTGKLFEYMATGVPILSLGSKRASAIGRLLGETGVGLCSEDEKGAIRGVLLDRMANRRPAWFAPDLTEILRYSRENQASVLLRSMIRLRDQRVSGSTE